MYFLSSTPCPALWVRRGHWTKQSMEPAVCAIGWRRWGTQGIPSHAQPPDLAAAPRCIFCSPGCLTCKGQSQGLERKHWPEWVVRDGCVAWGRAQEGWVVSEFCPHRSSPHSQASEVLVACVAMGVNADQMAHPNINVFVCSVATWKDFSHFLWIDIAYQNFISKSDLCKQVSEHPLRMLLESGMPPLGF